MTALAVVPVREDVAVWPSVVALTQCLCDEIERSGLGPVCLCSPLPGAQVALDYGENGMAWVRVVSAAPSSVFPNPDSSVTASQCHADLAVELEVGIARCAPNPGDDGSLPTFSDQFEATRMQMADMAAMRRAVQCCAGERGRRLLLGAYSPNGPQGGVLWGTWSLWIEEGWGRGR